MKSIEKYVSKGTKGLVTLSLISFLYSCESFYKTPVKIAEEVGDMTYRIATLQVFSGEEESFGSGCINSPNKKEKSCKLYRKNKIDTNPDVYEEYFGVLDVELEKKEIKLVLGYYDGDMFDFNGNKVLTVVRYRGNKREDFITPSFGKIGYSYDKFTSYFRDIKVKRLDTSDNPLKNIMTKGIIDMVRVNTFRSKLHDRIREGLKLLDGELQEGSTK